MDLGRKDLGVSRIAIFDLLTGKHLLAICIADFIKPAIMMKASPCSCIDTELSSAASAASMFAPAASIFKASSATHLPCHSWIGFIGEAQKAHPTRSIKTQTLNLRVHVPPVVDHIAHQAPHWAAAVGLLSNMHGPATAARLESGQRNQTKDGAKRG